MNVIHEFFIIIVSNYSALKNIIQKRGLVISRSTYPGSGTHCGHWLGDNASQWPHIRQSIPGQSKGDAPLHYQPITTFYSVTLYRYTEFCSIWYSSGMVAFDYSNFILAHYFMVICHYQVGADICGFFGDTNEQLCTRWQQLGAFYPFSRNHNTYNAIVSIKY